MGGIDRLCFGTSTFVAGRLRPDKDSAPGIAALKAAIEAGVRLIHSNPRLRTQWAVRDVLDQFRPPPPVRHVIKAEAPLEARPHAIAAKIGEAIGASRALLGVDRVHAIVFEIDIKRTRQPELLNDASAAAVFYQRSAHVALASGCVDNVYAYCHRPAHVTGALTCPDIVGVASQYHCAAPWAAEHLTEITSTGRIFVGMSPLNRGQLLERDAGRSNGRLAALEWALADSRVSAVTITMSSVAHLDEVIHTVEYVESSNGDGRLDYRLVEHEPSETRSD